MRDENINPDAPLHVRGLNHLTMPVKDRYRAARFYIVVLGAAPTMNRLPTVPQKVSPGHCKRAPGWRPASKSICLNKIMVSRAGINPIRIWLWIVRPKI